MFEVMSKDSNHTSSQSNEFLFSSYSIGDWAFMLLVFVYI